MDSQNRGFRSIDEYIASFPEDAQASLQTMRATVRAAAPDAVERISYQMPTFAQEGNLVHFAARKDGIGFYPTSSGIAAFQQELAHYKGTKGAVRFPQGQPLPLELITRIVQFRLAENLSRAAARAQAKKARRRRA